MTARPYRWLVESLLFLLYLVFGISWLAWSPLLADVEKAFQVSHSEAGMLISTVSMAKAFVPILAGLLAARLGTRYAIAVGAALASAAVLAPHAPTFKALLGLRFLFGIGGAMIVTLMGAAVMEWFPGDELPFVNGLNNVAVNCGITVAMYVSVPLAAAFGWRTALTGLGASSVVLALAWLVLARDGRRTASRCVANVKTDASPLACLSEIVRLRETWLVALAFTGPLSLYLSLNTWLPTHYQAAFGLSKDGAAHATGLFNLVGIPTALFGGWLSARLGLRRPLILLGGAVMPLAAAGMVAFPNASLRAACAVLLGTAFFIYISPLFTIPMELPGMTASRVGLLTGVVYSVAYTISSISPSLVGALEGITHSFMPGLLLMAVGSLSLAVAGLFLPETGPAAVPPARERTFIVRLRRRSTHAA